MTNVKSKNRKNNSEKDMFARGHICKGTNWKRTVMENNIFIGIQKTVPEREHLKRKNRKMKVMKKEQDGKNNSEKETYGKGQF